MGRTGTRRLLGRAVILPGGVHGLGRAGPGVFAEDEVQERAGAQLVHAALQPGRAQLTRPGGDPLVAS